MASAHGLFPGRALEKNDLSCRPASCPHSHEAALIVARQPQVPHCRPSGGGRPLKQCLASGCHRCVGPCLPPGARRSLGLSLSFKCAGKASGCSESTGSTCCILCPSFLPSVSHHGALILGGDFCKEDGKSFLYNL